MLKKWTLTNFKSFKDRTELSLAPITVLAGANSSGKSTIIQSILLLKQTVEYIPSTRAIGLNGPLLKLGRFDDIKNAASEEPDIHLSWMLDKIANYKAGPVPTFDSYAYSYFGRAEKLDKAVFEISFSVAGDSAAETGDRSASRSSSELRQLHPILLSSTCAIDYSTMEESKEASKNISIKIRRHPSKKVSTADAPTLSQVRQSLLYSVENLDSAARRELNQDRPEAKVIGASARHFFPDQFGISYNKSKNVARKIAALVSSSGQYMPSLYDRDVISAVVPAEWIKLVRDLVLDTLASADPSRSSRASTARVQEQFMSFEPRDISARELQDTLQVWLRRLDPQLRSRVRSVLAEHHEELETKYLEIAALPDETGFDLTAPRMAQYGIEQAEIFFRHSIRYLGPLRDEPRPVYPLEASVNPTDVGYRGEHTAAVLDLYRDRVVQYIRSVDADRPMNAQLQAAPLHTAVTDWLSYLGVAQSVRTTDLGKIGHQLQVRTEDVSKDHDLTNVGVGVSQLLPIIVMALLAPIAVTTYI